MKWNFFETMEEKMTAWMKQALTHVFIGGGIFLSILGWAGMGVTWAQIDEVQQGGQELFRQHCVACHGTNGKGTGPLTSDLIGVPANLTELAMRNKGTFPFWRTYRIIDGREYVAQHGVREMPVWVNWFQIPEDEGHGATDWRDQVRGRI